MPFNSIGQPHGPHSSTCGYCSPPGVRSETRSNHNIAGLDVTFLSCEVYQKMIDRGWRRSGTWCYKPNLKTSCCPQYTIRLDALEFKASRSQRKLVHRWNRFVTSGKENDTTDISETRKTTAKAPKSDKLPVFSLSSIHASEYGYCDEKISPVHKFETTLEPSSYTAEKFELFEKYQRTIHADDTTPSGFKSFLVDSPLQEEPIHYEKTPAPDHLPLFYGSYHQLYRLDGQLVAMAVIDILPSCVSSVYFMYDIAWQEFSLGKLSALREAALAQEIREAGVPQMGYLYMGFYIHSCKKMRYKGEYTPSYLADPETYIWFPLPTCLPLLEQHRYACFSHPEHSLAGPPDEGDDDVELTPLGEEDLDRIRVITLSSHNEIVLVPTNVWYESYSEALLACAHGLGIETVKDIIFFLQF